MTDQEIFDKVATHLLAQNAKSMNESGCAYRGYCGRKCAIGCLIPDDKYHPDIENQTLEADCVRAALEDGISLKSMRTLGLMVCLQSVHDNAAVQDWHFRLTEVAEKWGIDPEMAL